MVQAWYRRSSTELQRVESLTRSPIYVSFDATLDGLTSIRAYDRQASFIKRNQAAVNANTVPALLLSLSSSWLAMRLDSIGALLAFGVAAVAASTTGFIPAGWVGVGLSTALEMTAFLKHGVRMLAQAETMMNSVERVKEFSEDTPVEAKLVYTKGYLSAHPELVKPPATWPAAGRVQFDDVKMRYGMQGRQGPEVLCGISFDVPAKAKVGVVGRTGSGKSSTAMALFRMVELCGGMIKLDGVDISKVALGRLRSSLAIVPQDPVLFSPSVRVNLDPFNKHSDAALRRALKRVELDGKLDLDDDVTQGGANLSQGTRQLICIARAILRHPRVLVMDEATASVDERTDEVVQRAMREAFRDSTVLVIAHRLRTIADSDYVLVLDNGKVAEFDHPHTLLADKTRYPDSQFRALVSQTREQKEDIHLLAKRAAAAAGVPVVEGEAADTEAAAEESLAL
jgi:ATP-binding cassette subfamily C (CFTR/MRP) protein 1